MSTMKSGTSTCSTSAPVIEPKRCTAVRSCAGRYFISFCLWASSHTATPTYGSIPVSTMASGPVGLNA